MTKTTGGGVILNWNGFAGPYQVEKCPKLGGGGWQAVGTATDKTLSLPSDDSAAFFRINGAAPHYAGAETCSACHSGQHTSWLATRHAGALETLKAINQQTNAQCLVCHTVGYGLPSGFKDEATTPGLAGVQCENCHGPGGDHANDPLNAAIKPVKELSGMLCGGCHTDAHHPNYDEWSESGHHAVTGHVAEYFLQYGEARMQSCGACHSGAVRLAMLKGALKNKATVYPAAEDAANTGVTCAVCHDAHTKTANGSQLRNPTASLIPFSYSTSTNTSFAAQYNPQVSTCGQCHNLRGGTWKDSGRPPHHSVQYNMLIGNGGVEDGTAPQSKHRENATQCAGCHVYKIEPATVTESTPVISGHTFQPSMAACEQCHKAPDDPAARKTAIQSEVTQRIQAVKALLDSWGSTKAPDALKTKYGNLAWEYTSAGQLSNPAGSATLVGPSSSEQASVPDNIKQARFNLYLVEHDQSKGVHNAQYAKYLLDVAEAHVKIELAR